MLYTGYFAKTKKYIEAGLTPVSIAGITPKFFTYGKWTILAPRIELFTLWKTGQISDEEYVVRYKNYLFAVLDESRKKKLYERAQGNDIILCCYEKSEDFCHRHALAEWLNENLGLDVKEYEI